MDRKYQGSDENYGPKNRGDYVCYSDGDATKGEIRYLYGASRFLIIIILSFLKKLNERGQITLFHKNFTLNNYIIPFSWKRLNAFRTQPKIKICFTLISPKVDKIFCNAFGVGRKI